MMHPPLKGKNLAIITHAGGPAVMLTDQLAQGGMDVPQLDGPAAEELLTHLFPGFSVANPIDLLATGNAEQVGLSIDYCENSFEEIDGIVVIFGTPGLFPVFDVYKVLWEKMQQGSKPIYPVLPSVTTAAREVEEFLSHGAINFPDEVQLGQALTRIHATSPPAVREAFPHGIDLPAIEQILEGVEDGSIETNIEPYYPEPLAEAINTMRHVIEASSLLKYGDPRANIIEPHLGYSLRKLEMELAPGTGMGHSLVGVFEIDKEN